MKNKTRVVAHGSSSLSTLLIVAFVVLKLCGVIDWAWVWVLVPLWITWGFVLIVVLTCLIGLGIRYVRRL